MERKYSLSEIDQMREFFRWRLPIPMVLYSGGVGSPMRLTEESAWSIERRNREAEDQLRTAMSAGIDPAECVIPTQVAAA